MGANYEVCYATHPEDVRSYDTKRIRGDPLIEKILPADEVSMVYSMYDRMTAGRAMPVDEVLKPETTDPLKVPYFPTRREIGILDVRDSGVAGAGNATF